MCCSKKWISQADKFQCLIETTETEISETVYSYSENKEKIKQIYIELDFEDI